MRDAVTASGDPVVKRKHKFHMGDENSDREDEGEPWAESPEDVDGGTHEGTSNNEHSPEDGWLKEKMKDDIRRYHVLMELLSTEMGYLMDLRELVNVSSHHSVNLVMCLIFTGLSGLHTPTTDIKLSTHGFEFTFWLLV